MERTIKLKRHDKIYSMTSKNGIIDYDWSIVLRLENDLAYCMDNIIIRNTPKTKKNKVFTSLCGKKYRILTPQKENEIKQYQWKQFINEWFICKSFSFTEKEKIYNLLMR